MNTLKTLDELSDAWCKGEPKNADKATLLICGMVLTEVLSDMEPVPAWHARPTSPGWWILKWNDGNYRIMHFREHELKSIAGWVMRCYGPIPEPPEPTP